MAHLCDYTYAELAANRTRAQMAELDTLLAPPEEKERAVAKQNQESMAQLGIGMVAPPPRKA